VKRIKQPQLQLETSQLLKLVAAEVVVEEDTEDPANLVIQMPLHASKTRIVPQLLTAVKADVPTTGLPDKTKMLVTIVMVETEPLLMKASQSSKLSQAVIHNELSGEEIKPEEEAIMTEVSSASSRTEMRDLLVAMGMLMRSNTPQEMVMTDRDILQETIDKGTLVTRQMPVQQEVDVVETATSTEAEATVEIVATTIVLVTLIEEVMINMVLLAATEVAEVEVRALTIELVNSDSIPLFEQFKFKHSK
jgi:hypothetical protein